MDTEESLQSAMLRGVKALRTEELDELDDKLPNGLDDGRPGEILAGVGWMLTRKHDESATYEAARRMTVGEVLELAERI